MRSASIFSRSDLEARGTPVRIAFCQARHIGCGRMPPHRPRSAMRIDEVANEGRKHGISWVADCAAMP